MTIDMHALLILLFLFLILISYILEILTVKKKKEPTNFVIYTYCGDFAKKNL